jgi:hypothetical protein
MDPGKSYCASLSVDVDRFSDRKLRPYTRAVKFGGRFVSVEELRAKCREARNRGLEVFPSCDNVDVRGHCQGHPLSGDDARTDLTPRS